MVCILDRSVRNGDFGWKWNHSHSLAKLPELPFQISQDRMPAVELTVGIVGCETTASWNNVASVFPNPLLEADNTSVCAGESWMANITGSQELTALGATPADNIDWTILDADVGVAVNCRKRTSEAHRVGCKPPTTSSAPWNTAQV